MPQWYESILQQTTAAIAGAWSDVVDVVRPEQLQRRNWNQDLENANLHFPLAIVHVGRAASATDFSADRVALRVAVTVYRIERWEGAGGDQTTDVFGACADLAYWLHTNALTDLLVDMSRGVEINSSATTNAALMALMRITQPLTCASLKFDALTGFR